MSELAPTTISRPRSPESIPGYRLLEVVGKGGMGEVHAAMQLSLGRKVAIKLLAPNLASDASFVARFEKEAAALAALSHPHVVAIVDKGQADGTYFLVMEFVTGPSLRELMRAPEFDSTSALKAMLEVARAIEYAHKRGVIHRDLKPENILLDDPAGRIAKVSDFGLAAFLVGEAAARYDVTGTHVAMGTAAYMAPEQRTDAKNADHRADLYALGVMLYETLTGQLPVGSFAPPSQLKPGLDPRLDSIIDRCLKQAPVDRYASAAALISDLEPLAPNSFTRPPTPLSPIQKVAHSARRAAKATARGTALLIVLAAASVLVLTAVRNTVHVESRTWPGSEVAGDLGSEVSKAWAGRVAQRKLEHDVSAGEGPDTLALLTAGRDVTLSGTQLTFGSPDPHQAVGRALLDLTEVEGDSCKARAQAAYSVSSDWRTSLRRTLLGVSPEPRAALLLEGSPGRYAALVVGPAGNPARLEYVLGERRGAMLGPPSPASASALELEVTPEGELRAFVGAGGDRRPVGEPVSIGHEWRKAFGRLPRPAAGCLDGTCVFSDLRFSVTQEPPPPPPAPTPTPPVVASAPEPTPPPASAKEPESPDKHGHSATASSSKKSSSTLRQGSKEEGTARKESTKHVHH